MESPPPDPSFFCEKIAILISLNKLSSCVNSKLCKLLKLAILLIYTVEFCSWTMHTDAVVPLTGLSFNAVCMFLAETTLWLSLQYLLIDSLNGHRFLSHIFFPACGLESDRTSRVRLPDDIRALVQMIPAYCCDSNLLHPIL